MNFSKKPHWNISLLYLDPCPKLLVLLQKYFEKTHTNFELIGTGYKWLTFKNYMLSEFVIKKNIDFFWKDYHNSIFDKNNVINYLRKFEMPHCAEMDSNNPHRLIDHLQFHIFHLLPQNQPRFQFFAHCDFHLRWFTCPLVFGFWLLSYVIYIQAEKKIIIC